jgi:hypothetical protein
MTVVFFDKFCATLLLVQLFNPLMAFPSVLLKQLASSLCDKKASAAAMRAVNLLLSTQKRKCQVATSADIVVQPIEVT